ncbi:MAG: DUF4981 domain-containing protein, partial [Bacteroidales bacterium]|nr:DUF4981 domain-containing protein [Bacteroidales bacterium]
PHLSEVKKVYEPIQIKYLGNGTIEIENKNFFTNLSDKSLQIKLLIDGKPNILKSAIELDVPAQSKISMQFSEIPDMFNPENEYILEVSLIQKKASEMLPKGHEIAWDQFILNKGIHISAHSEGNELTISSSEEIINIQNNQTILNINAKSGEIESWSHNLKVITTQAIRPNFWRPPTDNDLGNNMQKWAKIWQDASYQYKASLIVAPENITNGVSYSVSYKLPNNEADVVVKYTLTNSGNLNVDYSFKPNKRELPNIPRLGMYLTLPNDFKEVSWYGKGPKESYWDRKSGQKIGIYSGKIIDQFEPYPRPQETGNKSDVRWMEVSSNDLSLKVISSHLLNSSIWPFAMKEIDFTIGDAGESASGLVPVTKKHGADIKLGNTIQWNIDFLQMGVGGDTSWGRLVHSEYTISANKTYHYSFTIQPFD